MYNFKKTDDFINKLSDYILYILIVVVLFLFIHKSIVGRQMMYEDYYDTHQSKQSK